MVCLQWVFSKENKQMFLGLNLQKDNTFKYIQQIDNNNAQFDWAILEFLQSKYSNNPTILANTDFQYLRLNADKTVKIYKKMWDLKSQNKFAVIHKEIQWNHVSFDFEWMQKYAEQTKKEFFYQCPEEGDFEIFQIILINHSFESYFQDISDNNKRKYTHNIDPNFPFVHFMLWKESSFYNENWILKKKITQVKVVVSLTELGDYCSTSLILKKLLLKNDFYQIVSLYSDQKWVFNLLEKLYQLGSIGEQQLLTQFRPIINIMSSLEEQTRVLDIDCQIKAQQSNLDLVYKLLTFETLLKDYLSLKYALPQETTSSNETQFERELSHNKKYKSFFTNQFKAECRQYFQDKFTQQMSLEDRIKEVNKFIELHRVKNIQWILRNL